ncbi:hypothetical protein P389DRAFT_195127 [Cystobasidium minutum MCA 4210]|uniref:uncharacterized protein n=1 Tax=Cystobasidium minutum MCA 4210 TaxID=1397322 RepID=UPI0034CFE491|eukprot:jgi/Rhomi1/195127/gm1.3341_g
MAPKLSAETADRLQRAAVAKNELVSQYLHLATNFKRCSTAVEAYAHALNEATEAKEIADLLKAPMGKAMTTGFPPYLPFIGLVDDSESHANGTSKKRSKSEVDEAAALGGAESDTELDANGKKKRKKAAKKLKDPDAPKRPPSAYIIFQNEIREKVKESNPGVPYSEILQQVSEQWKALGEEKQRVFKDKADAAMAAWRETAAEYTKNKDEDEHLHDGSMAVDPTENAAIQAALTAKPKKEKKPSSKKESKAAVAAPATSTPAAVAAPASKKDAKKDAKPKSVAAPTAATSTPQAKNAALPKPASPVKAPATLPTKKNVPQTTQDSSSESDDESSSEDSSSESD